MLGAGVVRKLLTFAVETGVSTRRRCIRTLRSATRADSYLVPDMVEAVFFHVVPDPFFL